MTDFTFPSDQDRADNEELDRVCVVLEETLEREDVLAAHVERLKEVDRDETCYGQIIMDILDMTPTTSLARRDLIKQAEALEYAAGNIVKWCCANALMNYAEKLKDNGSIGDYTP